MKKLITIFFITLIKIYQFAVSPFIGRQCNFYPTCSNYAILAIKKHGIFKGCKMAFIRILKCNPACKEFKHDEP